MLLFLLRLIWISVTTEALLMWCCWSLKDAQQPQPEQTEYGTG